jgi:hypothetical protein
MVQKGSRGAASDDGRGCVEVALIRTCLMRGPETGRAERRMAMAMAMQTMCLLLCPLLMVIRFLRDLDPRPVVLLRADLRLAGSARGRPFVPVVRLWTSR